jgi:hypothetical protein
VTKLVDVAHCRAGDKGSDALLVVVPYASTDLDMLITALTPDVLARHFGDMPVDHVSIQPATGLGALVVTLRGRLGGGVTRSLAIDSHGKTLSGHLLRLELTWT